MVMNINYALVGSTEAYYYYVIQAILERLGILSIGISLGEDVGTVLVTIKMKKYYKFFLGWLVKWVIRKKLNQPNIKPLTDLIIVELI
jgi:hypothetical protein